MKGLAIATVTAAVLVASTSSAQPYDHLKCYKIRDVETFSAANADIETIEATFGLQNCRIKKKAKQICIPASKSDVLVDGGTYTPFAVPTDDLMFEQVCYKVSCPQETIAPQTISDEFGTRLVDGLKVKTLCVPAVFGPPPTTSTTSTTTTTSTTSTTLFAPAVWSIRAGNAASQSGFAIGVDSGGNVIAAGSFAGDIDFGLGALTSAGGTDIYVVKLDPSGTPIWNARYGDAASQQPVDLDIDSGGNIVITGIFQGSVDFGGGPLSSDGSNDIFVVQLAPDGSHEWSADFGGTGIEFGLGVAVDATDDVLITGSFGSTSVDFGGGAIALVGGTDCYIARFSSAGAHEASFGYGGLGASCLATGIATDPMGNVLMAASLFGTVNFGGGGLMSSGLSDMVAAKFDLAGMHVWSKRFGDGSNQQSGAIHSSATLGGTYLIGNAAGTTDFGGGGLMSAGVEDVVTARLDGNGSHVWSKIIGDASMQTAADVHVDASGNVHVTGAFQGTVDFGGGGVMSAGGNDGFVLKLASDGSFVSNLAISDVGEQTVARIDVDAAGNRYVTGSFAGTIDLGDGPMMSAGATDVFVAKLAP